MAYLKTKTFCLLVWPLLILLWTSCAQKSADPQGRLAPLLEGMGDWQFTVTTKNALAQRFFNQGLVLSYAFNHKEAERAFHEAARLDPDCAMAYWGAALVLGPNINAAMDATENANAFAAIQKAVALAPQASAKEQAFINALAQRYAEKPPASRAELDVAYANAMREVAQKYPEDADAAALFAEAAMDLHPWKYWEKDGQPKPWTLEIMSTIESGLQKWPQHPGLNHFYIHAAEASAEPGRALASAELLRDLVPAAGHLVHMPAHILIRTGRYHDAIVANERAIAADSNYITQCHAQGMYPVAYVPHNHHFLSAAATFGGNSAKALMAAHHMAMNQDRKLMREPGYGTLQHYMMIPLYAMIKFGKWEEILQAAAPDSDLLYPRGVWHFSRGMAYTRKNQIDNAAQELKQLKTIAADTSLLKVTIWDINTTFDLLQIATAMLSGELAAKQRHFPTAIQHLQRAVALEENLTYDEPPPWYTPARHNLGAILLEAGRAVEAQKVYEADLKKYPENGWALFGLQQSLLAQNKNTEAEAAKQRFAQAWLGADVVLNASRF